MLGKHRIMEAENNVKSCLEELLKEATPSKQIIDVFSRNANENIMKKSKYLQINNKNDKNTTEKT